MASVASASYLPSGVSQHRCEPPWQCPEKHRKRGRWVTRARRMV